MPSYIILYTPQTVFKRKWRSGGGGGRGGGWGGGRGGRREGGIFVDILFKLCPTFRSSVLIKFALILISTDRVKMYFSTSPEMG